MKSNAESEVEQNKLPRWAQILAGLLLLPFSLMCLAGSLVLAFAPSDKAPSLAIIVGIAFVLICFWVLWLSVRLLTGHAGRGLMRPFALKAASLLFVVLPIGGLFTGYWRHNPVVASVQTFFYLVLAFALWRLAKQRTVKS